MDPMAGYAMPMGQLPHQSSQLMNPSQQLYGPPQPTYDGLGMAQIPPDMAAYMFSDPSLMEDTIDAKRRRIAKACDCCRRKKIRCDGKFPACTHCLNYKTECVYTQVEKKRAPPKGAKYIEAIENRLLRMENLLRLSGIIDDDDGDVDLGEIEKKLEAKKAELEQQQQPETKSSPASSHTASAANGGVMTPQSSLASPDASGFHDEKHNLGEDDQDGVANPKEQEVEALSEMMCSLVTNGAGETSSYVGSSSGFSIFSPKGVQWVNEKTGDESFQQMISTVSMDDHKWDKWKPEIFGDLFRRPVFQSLPPRDDAMSLLKDFFDNFNCMFPLFHEPTFMHLARRQYSTEPYESPGWWASINVALAIAHRLRVMTSPSLAEEDKRAWGYMKNAMAVFSEITMRNTDLMGVQGLLGMALFLQGTPNPQPMTILVGTAIRLSHNIGLHKRGTGFNLNPIEIEQRRRVFWIGYMLDKDLCLRSGRPVAQDDDDMNVELPDADPADNIGNIPLADGKSKMNLFRMMAELALIESKVYKRLYSTKAVKQSDGELLHTISDLDQELEDWKNKMPVDFRPEEAIQASHTPLILHVVMLHLTYYNCLITIHRMSIQQGYWTSRLSDYAIRGLNSKPLNPRVFRSAMLCTSAARATISLLEYIPQGDNSCVWMVLYFPVVALVTLFSNIIQNPLDMRAKSDVRLMEVVVSFLSELGQEAETGGVHRMLGICSEFERIAKVVIDKAEKEQSSRRKRKSLDPGSAHMPPAYRNAQASRPPPMPTRPPSTPHDSNGKLRQSSHTPKSSRSAGSTPTPYNQHRGSLSPPSVKSESGFPPLGANSQMPSPNFPPAGWTGHLGASSSSAAPDNGMTAAAASGAGYTSSDLSEFQTWAEVTGFGAPQQMMGQAIPPGLSMSQYAAGLQQQQQQQGNGGHHGSHISAVGNGGGGGIGGPGMMPNMAHPQPHPPIFGGLGPQPLVQDLFALPGSYDYSWAEMSGGAYPTVENGNFESYMPGQAM